MDSSYKLEQETKYQDYGKLECYVEGKKVGEEKIENPNSTGGTVRARGLKPLTTYRNVYVRVYDNAGNYRDTYPITGTTIGILGTPIVEVARGTEGPVKGNYRGDVLVIRIRDSITENSGATKIKYTVDGGKTYKELNSQGTETEFNIYNEGSYTIYAYMKNSGGESGKSNELKVVLDRTKPTVTLAQGTSTTTNLSVRASSSDNLSRNILIQLQMELHRTKHRMDRIICTTSNKFNKSRSRIYHRSRFKNLDRSNSNRQIRK